jgi:hypothetical protein
MTEADDLSISYVAEPVRVCPNCGNADGEGHWEDCEAAWPPALLQPGWYFFTEWWAHRAGPFASVEDCRVAQDRYLADLEARCATERALPPVGGLPQL